MIEQPESLVNMAEYWGFDEIDEPDLNLLLPPALDFIGLILFVVASFRTDRSTPRIVQGLLEP